VNYFAKINSSFYNENDSPQPQVLVALGLLKTNPIPFKPPENSKMVPAS
jgi:hypothetical protein